MPFYAKGSRSLPYATDSATQASVDRGYAARASPSPEHLDAVAKMMVFVICQTDEQQHEFCSSDLQRHLTTQGIRFPITNQSMWFSEVLILVSVKKIMRFSCSTKVWAGTRIFVHLWSTR